MAASGTSRRPFPLPGAAVLLSATSDAGALVRREAAFLVLSALALFLALAA